MLLLPYSFQVAPLPASSFDGVLHPHSQTTTSQFSVVYEKAYYSNDDNRNGNSDYSAEIYHCSTDLQSYDLKLDIVSSIICNNFSCAISKLGFTTFSFLR